MDIFSPELLKILINGGVAVIVFVIWYITFTRISKQNQETMENLVRLLQEDIKYKEVLTGVLNRLELKLDVLSKNYPSHW